jgi:DNA-binding ferritin-like protein (Dps family)
MTMLISRLIGDKRRWRRYTARVKVLPEPYRAAVHAIERYLFLFGRGDGAGWAEMLEDLADLFERAAADGTPIRQIFGAHPEEFVEAFVQNYPEAQWVTRERERLTNTIARAAGEGTGIDERAIR